MSRLQFIALLTPGLSSFVLVLLAWIQSNTRMSRIESLLDTTVSKQASDMERVTSKQASDMQAIRDLLRTIHNHLATFSNITARLEGRIDELSR